MSSKLSKLARQRAHARARRSGDNPEDVAFFHDDEVFTVDLHLGARPFPEQDLVAGLDVQRRHLALLGAGAGADGDDFALLRLFLRRVGNDNAPGGLLFRLDAADEDAVMKWPETHGCEPPLVTKLNRSVGTLPMRVPAMLRMWLCAVHLSTVRAAEFSACNGYE